MYIDQGAISQVAVGPALDGAGKTLTSAQGYTGRIPGAVQDESDIIKSQLVNANNAVAASTAVDDACDPTDP